VAVVFARELTAPLTSLVKKIDEATALNTGSRMGSFVVLLTDDEPAQGKRLKDLAKKEKLGDIVLTTLDPAGPEGYAINKDAEVTVLLYVGHVVKANYAYRKGQFREKDIDIILEGLPKIVTK
jgi:hypothetical protein